MLLIGPASETLRCHHGGLTLAFFDTSFFCEEHGKSIAIDVTFCLSGMPNLRFLTIFRIVLATLSWPGAAHPGPIHGSRIPGPVERALREFGATPQAAFAVSAPDRAGRLRVAVADIRPHSSSFWTTLRYAILEIGPAALPARRLQSGEQTLYEGNDNLSVTTQGDEFEFRFSGECVDSDVMNRIYVLRFRVTTAGAVRIAPFALNPRDLADEWISQPWSTAQAFTPRAGSKHIRDLAELKGIHTRLHELDSLGQISFVSPSDPLAAENGGDVDVRLEKGGIASFTIQGSGGSYSVVDIGFRKDNNGTSDPEKEE